MASVLVKFGSSTQSIGGYWDLSHSIEHYFIDVLGLRSSHVNIVKTAFLLKSDNGIGYGIVENICLKLLHVKIGSRMVLKS